MTGEGLGTWPTHEGSHRCLGRIEARCPWKENVPICPSVIRMSCTRDQRSHRQPHRALCVSALWVANSPPNDSTGARLLIEIVISAQKLNEYITERKPERTLQNVGSNSLPFNTGGCHYTQPHHPRTCPLGKVIFQPQNQFYLYDSQQWMHRYHVWGEKDRNTNKFICQDF